MKNEVYVNPVAIKDFFKMLEDAAIEYVLIKNVGSELPDWLRINKDIDILVKKEELTRCIPLLQSHKLEQTMHPYSLEAGWRLAYGATNCIKYHNGKGFEVDIHCELCLKSMMGNIWIPMDKYINSKVWSDKVWDKDNGWWIIDDETQLVYLISRCVFDKGTFAPVYIAEIEKRIHLLETAQVQRMLGQVFFRFEDVLTDMLINKQYNSIIDTYITFYDY